MKSNQSSNSQRISRIREKITQALQPSYLEVIDESAAHVGHPGSQSGAGHFAVIVACEKFKGENPVNCHRMIYNALGNMMQTDIHALRIDLR